MGGGSGPGTVKLFLPGRTTMPDLKRGLLCGSRQQAAPPASIPPSIKRLAAGGRTPQLVHHSAGQTSAEQASVGACTHT